MMIISVASTRSHGLTRVLPPDEKMLLTILNPLSGRVRPFMPADCWIMLGQDDGAGEALTVRWREPRVARGRPRLAQRVRAGVSVADVRVLLEGVARSAYADEFEVGWPDGSTSIHHRDVLLRWAEGGRVGPPTIMSPEWMRDQSTASGRAAAIDGMRDAVRRLLDCGLVDESWSDDIVRRLHVVLQSLPVTSVPLWRL